MEKCAIVGGTGFIGKNLISYIKEQGYDCRSISRKALYDIKNLDLNFETIIHTAGLAHDVKGSANIEKYYKANFELTKKLYDRFLRSDAKKFIFISSVKAVADDVDEVLTENASPNPKTYYGLTKLMAEQYILRQPLPAGKSFYVLRPCMTHGTGNKGNLNLLYKIISKGIPYPLAGYNNKRSFLSVQNLCFVIKELIERDDVPTDVYNIADDEPLSTAQVVSVLAGSIKKKPILWKISPQIVNFLASIGDLLQLPLTTERLKKMTESYVVSNSKIKAALKKQLPLNALDGLKLTAQSFNHAA